MPRSPRPDDLYSLRMPIEVRISPDGSRVAAVIKEASPDADGYRISIWLVPADGSTPARRLTLGARRDTAPAWSPDGTTLAFLSDRSGVLAAGGAGDRPVDPGAATPPRGTTQVWLLPMSGGEASQLTRLPEDVTELAWSPDGTRLCVVSSAVSSGSTRSRRAAGAPPERDARLIDRLQYQLNGVGFIDDKPSNLWIVDIGDGATRRLTSGPAHDQGPAWDPDGRRLAFLSDRHPAADLTWRTDMYVVDVQGGSVGRVSGGRGDRTFGTLAWSPDGSVIAAVGHRFPAGNASASSLWLFPPGANEAGRDLIATSGREIGAGLNSDLAGIPAPGLTWSGDAGWLVFAAPVDGAYELWRAQRDDGRVERLTAGEHAITRPSGVAIGDGVRLAVVLGAGDRPWDVAMVDVPAPTTTGSRGRGSAGAIKPRTVTRLMADAWADVAPVTPLVRWHEVDGRHIQGWFLEAPRRDGRPAPLVVQIHGGPATLYGWSMIWEWQCLVAAGISVYACNPRGSQGYGQDFAYANYADWGDGPMRDVMGGVDALIADGLVDGQRLGVTGGSYGGYLTAWIIGHTDRFAAAVSCRGVYDLTSEMLSGDLGGPLFGKYEYGANPWDDADLYRRHSPLTYARDIHTPLLIQHSEHDLRCPITQAEEMFTVLRSHRREVRLMRVPDESHELTRSGAPHRRVENLERIRDWFVHYLVDGKQGLPPT
jgi:dipeptidyl aminopeptidase/acylaminoacyl peptidase